MSRDGKIYDREIILEVECVSQMNSVPKFDQLIWDPQLIRRYSESKSSQNQINHRFCIQFIKYIQYIIFADGFIKERHIGQRRIQGGGAMRLIKVNKRRGEKKMRKRKMW